MKKLPLQILAFALITLTSETYGQGQKVIAHQNVVYGMISGMALLMDVYQPSKSNHFGIIYIPGSAYGMVDIYEREYNQVPLKDDYLLDTAYSGKWAHALVSKGYTVFVINHRFTPAFHYPDIFYDCQRAVRFIRYNAKKYGIDPNHIGAMGHSSGAGLSSMLGVRDTVIKKTESPIDGMSSRVQTVVALAPGVFDFLDLVKNRDTVVARAFVTDVTFHYVNASNDDQQDQTVLAAKCIQASPISYVTTDAASFLIYYSDDDPIVPARQVPAMYRKLRDKGVTAKMVMRSKEGHEPRPDMEEVEKWFQQNLK